MCFQQSVLYFVISFLMSVLLSSLAFAFPTHMLCRYRNSRSLIPVRMNDANGMLVKMTTEAVLLLVRTRYGKYLCGIHRPLPQIRRQAWEMSSFPEPPQRIQRSPQGTKSSSWREVAELCTARSD